MVKTIPLKLKDNPYDIVIGTDILKDLWTGQYWHHYKGLLSIHPLLHLALQKPQ